MDNVERLMEFGLTRHEASLYILLTLEGSLNGYEAAKQSGISRSNAYNALAGLVDKGAAYIQEEDTVRYTPVAIEEFCSNKIRHLEQKKTELIAELPVREQPSSAVSCWEARESWHRSTRFSLPFRLCSARAF